MKDVGTWETPDTAVGEYIAERVVHDGPREWEMRCDGDGVGDSGSGDLRMTKGGRGDLASCRDSLWEGGRREVTVNGASNNCGAE